MSSSVKYLQLHVIEADETNLIASFNLWKRVLVSLKKTFHIKKVNIKICL